MLSMKNKEKRTLDRIKNITLKRPKLSNLYSVKGSPSIADSMKEKKAIFRASSETA